MRRIAVLLMLFALLASVAAAGCGGGEEAAPTAETVEGGGTETGETTETHPTETETTETETTEEGAAHGDAAAGEEVFATAGCGGCHTLEAAGSSGNVGPNLDDSHPAFELVVDRVTNGQGAMPSFKDQLSADDINNVAAYVVQSTSG